VADEHDIVGKGWSFPPSFDAKTRGVEMRRGTRDIEESLRIIFSTSIGERLMQPTFGCNLADHVFEPLNAGQIAYIRTLVETAILYNEPRIDAEVELELDAERNALIITVDYTIRGTNSRFNFVFPYYIREARV
jgi:phage baseplate assembly protein W